jgi:hypothetical protein
MNLQELCFSVNETLLSNFAQSFNISLEDLKSKLILVSKYQELIDMALQINKVLKTNPKAFINFGDYGRNLSKKLNLDEQEMYQALLVSSNHDLLINIVLQLKTIYDKEKSDEDK